MGITKNSKASLGKKAKTNKKKAAKKSAKKGVKKATKKASQKAPKASPKANMKNKGKGSTAKSPNPPAKKAKTLRKDPDLEIDQEVLEFIAALDEYKKKNNRLFPSNSEILQVLKDLGYRKS